jgi:rhamnosyl/mannosyltransferase
VLKDFQERCRVIPFGIPVAPFETVDTQEVDAIRRRFKTPLVLAVGRLVYYKGFEYLIRAMKDVAAHLVIVGHGPLEQKLLAEANRLQISHKITILNDVENVVPFYHAAELFVLPSIARSEAFGIVQLEAMACGRPVINTNLDSGVPFVSLNGETGLTVTPGDDLALGQAITKLLADPALRAKFGQAGQKRVLKHFSLDSMTRQTLQLYDRALTRS